MPVRHARSETRGRPPFGRRGGIGKNGWIRSHNASGSSVAAIPCSRYLAAEVTLRRFCYTLLEINHEEREAHEENQNPFVPFETSWFDSQFDAGTAGGTATAPCGWVPLMNASLMPESSVTKTMLPGASNCGTFFRSARVSM